MESLASELQNFEKANGEKYLLLIADHGGSSCKLILQDLTKVLPNSPFGGYLVGEMEAKDTYYNLKKAFGHYQVHFFFFFFFKLTQPDFRMRLTVYRTKRLATLQMEKRKVWLFDSSLAVIMIFFVTIMGIRGPMLPTFASGASQPKTSVATIHGTWQMLGEQQVINTHWNP